MTSNTEKTGLRGVWPALLTPLTPQLDIDHALLAAHSRRLLDAGCAGVTLFGTTGEGPSFSFTERQQALQVLVDSGIAAAQILVSTSCAALPETVELSRHALNLGCPACLILPPFFLKGVPDQGVVDAYRLIVEQVDDERLKIVLYHLPQVAGVGLSVGVIRALLDIYPDTIIGLKDSGCQREDSVAFAQAFMPPLQVWVGNELDLQVMAALGTKGAVSGVANVLPRLVGQLISDGASPRAPAQMARIRAFLDLLGGYGMTAAFKGIMAELDQQPGWRHVRPPLVALNDAEITRLRGELGVFGVDRALD